MDKVVADVVTQSASKVSFDKKFFVGVAVGAAAAGAIVGAAKLRSHFSKDVVNENLSK